MEICYSLVNSYVLVAIHPEPDMETLKRGGVFSRPMQLPDLPNEMMMTMVMMMVMITEIIS